MTHLSEDVSLLSIKTCQIHTFEEFEKATIGLHDVCLLVLPDGIPEPLHNRRQSLESLIRLLVLNSSSKATLVVIGESPDLVEVHRILSEINNTRYQSWIAIKRPHPVAAKNQIPNQHFGALIHTRYQTSLRHTRTRIQYTYCPACGKTTKDYGGKKHTYHKYGTLMSDVWRDLSCELVGDIMPLVERFADLFGLKDYQELRVLDCRSMTMGDKIDMPDMPFFSQTRHFLPLHETNKLIHADCMDVLHKFPDNSIDFIFTDPPYNVGKNYKGYNDDLSISEYFTWCDSWLTELARILRPGRTLALLNIPLWAIRHFLHLQTLLHFQNWIVWDALSFPVRRIMPAHYAILCFSKEQPRPLPGLNNTIIRNRPLNERQTFRQSVLPGFSSLNSTPVFQPLAPLAEGYCLRSGCVKKRARQIIDDRGQLSDLIWDIHRIKHNSRRVDHPTQLPPQLMYRLISIFTQPGEVVLDCFNGSGTTTLAAHQLNRRYIGIEIVEKYHLMALERHQEIEKGLDPFRKAERILTAKNSPVPRLKKQKYEIPKKTLQLEVRRVAKALGHLPTRDELIQYGNYPIKYYDEYFFSWGEVCAAARTTGMSELPPSQK